VDKPDSAETFNLEQIQAFHRKLDTAKGFDRDPVRNVAYLVEELGEVASTVRRLSRARAGDDMSDLLENLAEELADCLAYLAKLANYHEIDLNQAYTEKMRRNELRTWSGLENGSPSNTP
jgi:NTP pyrophosphatase (non-canonical NTP hydrolase)